VTPSKTVGLVAAPFSPFHPDRSLNLDAVEGYVEWLVSQGVIGAFVCGTTGEGMSLTTEERQRLAERWVAVAPPNLKVIVHVGHTSLGDCVELAAHAQSIGAAAVSCMSPFFFKPADVETLVDWCDQVAAAAPQLPFYFYNIPSMTGVTTDVSRFLELAEPRIPNLVGAKYTYEDLDDFARCVKLRDGRFDLLFGRDEILLQSLRAGARGAVGSTYNFAAPVYHAVIRAFEAGDQEQAERAQQVAARMIDAFLHCGAQPITAFKWFMGRLAVDCGPSRLPLRDPRPEHLAKLEASLDATGVWDYVKPKTPIFTSGATR
jgi:N-acetylneuraminate lyase